MNLELKYIVASNSPNGKLYTKMVHLFVMLK